MTRRRLNRRQAWRVQQIQKDRLQRAQRRSQRSEQSHDDSTLGPECLGQVIAHYGVNLDVEDEQGQLVSCVTRANLPKLVCGDRVIWQRINEQHGVIVTLVPRTSLLARPDPHKHLKPIAANIDQILIVTAPKPRIDEDLINRYIVAAELTSIKPVIVINKRDLLDESQYQRLVEQFSVYASLHYQLIFTSTKTKDGLSTLVSVLEQSTAAFVGQSGVGKSSLIQKLIPQQKVRIGALSESTGLGKHTTSVTLLYHTAFGAHVIDSPGVREFALDHVKESDIAQGFVEFRPYLGQCKFKDCKHLHEPGCAIRNAVENGDISAQRIESFTRIVTSLR